MTKKGHLFADLLLGLSKEHENVVILDPDTGVFLEESIPTGDSASPYVNVGCAGSHMFGLAMGFAAKGFHPICLCASPSTLSRGLYMLDVAKKQGVSIFLGLVDHHLFNQHVDTTPHVLLNEDSSAAEVMGVLDSFEVRTFVWNPHATLR